MYAHVSALPFERTGRLVVHEQGGHIGRPDAVEFQGRSGQTLVDWLAEVHIWVDRWPTRAGVAVLLERAGVDWVPCANALPYDAIYLRHESELQLVFSSYIPLEPGGTYRVHLPGAVVSRPTLRIGALQCEPGANDARTRPRRAARPSPTTTRKTA